MMTKNLLIGPLTNVTATNDPERATILNLMLKEKKKKKIRHNLIGGIGFSSNQEIELWPSKRIKNDK